MNTQALADYDGTRDFSAKAIRSLCYAPYTSLYFDPTGRVKACCHNWRQPLGNIKQNTLDEMWASAKTWIVRQMLTNYEFAPGCEFCDQQTADGWFTNAFMRKFDQFPVSSPEPEWPLLMEFAMSNVCNLECVMCSGALSSAIRSRREKLSPLPRLYTDDIIDSLRKYLPHLKQAKFLGGEPFLIMEYFRIWDMMVQDGLEIRCHVTTNGTQYNSRIERILEAIPMSFAVSLDGATKETVEAIRVNADYDQQMINLKRFRQYTRERKGTDLSLTYCLMRQNWHEFGDFCHFADEWDCSVGINTVINPPQFGLYTLDRAELKQIVRAMAAQAPRLDSELKRNRSVWFAEFERLRRRSEGSAR